VASLQLTPSVGYRPIGIILSDSHSSYASIIHNVPLITDKDAITALGRSGKCELLVEDASDKSGLLTWLQERFCRLVVIRELGGDLPIQGACVTVLGDLLGIQFTNSLLLWRNRAIKRALDLAIAIVLIGFSLPLIGLGALMVWCVDGRPLFFCQQRRGLNERLIRIWKLRTMYRDAEARLEGYLKEHSNLNKQWLTSCKLDDDPRVLPSVGRFLRRYSLDELPQLFSVLGGQMSLVGPRPFPDYHLDRLPKQARHLRHRALPGLTGMWQVSARGNGNLEAQCSYDVYYIRNWSLWLDLYILARTIRVVLSGKGAK
jgi:lipopolysaccharide/colanic/teichoic acid biosynthesis glycosyltransferase